MGSRGFGVVDAIALGATGLALVARTTGLPPGLGRAAGIVAAALLAGRVVRAAGLAARGRLLWSRLPFTLLVSVEGARMALGVVRGGLREAALIGTFEAGLLVVAGVAIVRGLRAARRDAREEDAVAESLERFVPGALARFIAFEIVVWRCAFGRGGSGAKGDGGAFGYASESPMKLWVLAYPPLILAEAVVEQLVLPARFFVLHVGIAAAEIYGFVWLLGVYRSMLGRPHVLEHGVLCVHRGLLGFASIPLRDVASAAPVEPEALAPRGEYARLDVGARRVLLALRCPAACVGPFRIRPASRIVVSADDPEALCRALSG
jgi:hypothetical protein